MNSTEYPLLQTFRRAAVSRKTRVWFCVVYGSAAWLGGNIVLIILVSNCNFISFIYFTLGKKKIKQTTLSIKNTTTMCEKEQEEENILIKPSPLSTIQFILQVGTKNQGTNQH